MKPYLFDIETMGLPEDKLLAMMTSELRSPQEPEEIKTFTPPDLSKCPVYAGDKSKQQAWIEKTNREAQEKFQKAKADWLLKTAEDRQKWISDAALHAPRGTLKILGLRDVTSGITKCLICDATAQEKSKIEAIKSWPCKVEFIFKTEVEALTYFAAFTTDSIGVDTGRDWKLIGYYIAGFDFPFLLRRAFITGSKPAKKLRKGRYWDNDLFTDLDEEYKMGERELKIGGLAGLGKILGVPEKEGSGENFGSLWREDCVKAISYHLAEGLVIEACAKKMGVI